MKKALLFVLLSLTAPAWASESQDMMMPDLTQHWVGFLAIAIFAVAYVLVILEEKIHLRKSKPILLAAGLIWILIALVYHAPEHPHLVEEAIRHNFLEYAELFFFLLVAMTYINSMLERGVFEALRDWLVSRGYSYKTLFWLTGILSFFISPIADNLTTALIMCAVVMAVGEGQPKFVGIACINIVVAANAGGTFSPFGDITTLMIWQKGIVDFAEFFALNRNKSLIDRYEQQEKNPFYKMELHVIRLGDIAIATNPFEMFLDFGLRIKARSKALQTFIVQLASACGGEFGAGYLPTEKAVAGGGYGAEVASNIVGPEGGQALVNQTVKLINEMWNGETK